ncbi:hypothetical protein BDQ17DRAFT_1435863 [Cyathus striatus]|nr:hypothetical protein BDQ17DRAFT_1435863 [Cyathus striatus]
MAFSIQNVRRFGSMIASTAYGFIGGVEQDWKAIGHRRRIESIGASTLLSTLTHTSFDTMIIQHLMVLYTDTGLRYVFSARPSLSRLLLASTPTTIVPLVHPPANIIIALSSFTFLVLPFVRIYD